MTSNRHSIADHYNWWQQHKLHGLSPAARIRVLEDQKADNILRLAQVELERDELCAKIEDLNQQIAALQRAS